LRVHSRLSASGGVAVSDPVHHPAHYKSKSGLEAIEVIEAFELGYALGNVVKYVLRSKHKGFEVQDLEKARWYLSREIDRLHRGSEGRPTFC